MLSNTPGKRDKLFFRKTDVVQSADEPLPQLESLLNILVSVGDANGRFEQVDLRSAGAKAIGLFEELINFVKIVHCHIGGTSQRFRLDKL